MRLVLILLLTTLASSALFGQMYDSVSFTRIRVNGLPFGSKKEDMIKKFGTPHKTITTESNKGADIYIDYKYQKSMLRVNPAGIFYGFTLKDNNFVFQIGKLAIRAGDSVKEFAINFPQSLKAYAKDKSGKFKLKIRPGNTFIILKTRDGIVTEMETKEETQ
ncbi:MAG: hypothetical protein ABIS69_02805 [Sediminibacterium sp.]